jgi:Ca2+-binding RTX toxin-like protein
MIFYYVDHEEDEIEDTYGNDTVYIENLDWTAKDVHLLFDDEFEEIETVYLNDEDITSQVITFTGTDDNDALEGDDYDNEVESGNGDDDIDSKNGDDKVFSGDGDDRTFGGGGDDEVYGGKGRDKLYGQFGKDKIFGGDDDDLVKGGGDDDFLAGNSGKVIIFGKDGDDDVRGGRHEDELYGGEGNDIIIGGYGNDLLKGGAGADRFVVYHNDLGSDIVLDFENDVDKLDFSDLLKSVGYLEESAVTDGYFNLEQTSTGVNVHFDETGNGLTNNSVMDLHGVNSDEITDTDFIYA